MSARDEAPLRGRLSEQSSDFSWGPLFGEVVMTRGLLKGCGAGDAFQRRRSLGNIITLC